MNRTEARVLEDYQLESSQVKQPLELKVSQRRGISRDLAVQLACSMAVVALLSIGYIGTNLRLYELTTQNTTSSIAYNALVSENQRISVSIEKNISVERIGEVAGTEYGMGAIQDYQKAYVNLKEEDTIEIVEPEVNPTMEKIGVLIEVFKNYIGL